MVRFDLAYGRGTTAVDVPEELRIPLALPEGRRCFLYRFDVFAPADRVTAPFGLVARPLLDRDRLEALVDAGADPFEHLVHTQGVPSGAVGGIRWIHGRIHLETPFSRLK